MFMAMTETEKLDAAKNMTEKEEDMIMKWQQSKILLL